MKNSIAVLALTSLAGVAQAAMIGPRVQGPAAGAASGSIAAAIGARPALMQELRLDGRGLALVAPVLAGASFDPSALTGPDAASLVREAVAAQSRLAIRGAAEAASLPAAGPGSAAYQLMRENMNETMAAARAVLTQDALHPLEQSRREVARLDSYLSRRRAMLKAASIAQALGASQEPEAAVPEDSRLAFGLTREEAAGARLSQNGRVVETLRVVDGVVTSEKRYFIARGGGLELARAVQGRDGLRLEVWDAARAVWTGDRSIAPLGAAEPPAAPARLAAPSRGPSPSMTAPVSPAAMPRRGDAVIHARLQSLGRLNVPVGQGAAAADAAALFSAVGMTAEQTRRADTIVDSTGRRQARFPIVGGLEFRWLELGEDGRMAIVRLRSHDNGSFLPSESVSRSYDGGATWVN
ncbi:MAG: hypothetical protein SF051_09175 [Elusimicrobiota bacterium]|nr:hypothetical protein [Elusimicrobiota bacterium]